MHKSWSTHKQAQAGAGGRAWRPAIEGAAAGEQGGALPGGSLWSLSFTVVSEAFACSLHTWSTPASRSGLSRTAAAAAYLPLAPAAAGSGASPPLETVMYVGQRSDFSATAPNPSFGPLGPDRQTLAPGPVLLGRSASFCNDAGRLLHGPDPLARCGTWVSRGGAPFPGRSRSGMQRWPGESGGQHAEIDAGPVPSLPPHPGSRMHRLSTANSKPGGPYTARARVGGGAMRGSRHRQPGMAPSRHPGRANACKNPLQACRRSRGHAQSFKSDRHSLVNPPAWSTLLCCCCCCC